MLYSSLNLDDVKDLFPIFESRFPGIQIEHVRANGEQLARRLIGESRRGSMAADLLETNGFEIYRAIKEGLADPFCPPNISDLNPQLYDRECRWIGTRTNHDVVAWNTRLVTPADAPRSYADLADPKWKGRLLVEMANVEMFTALLGEQAYGEVRGLDLFQGIAANDPKLHTGHGVIADLLAEGTGAIAVGAYAHRIEQLKARGAPVEWMQTEGVLYLQAAMLTRGGPHPNAGKLFLSWLVSQEGQTALTEVSNRYPVNLRVTRIPYSVPADFKSFPSRPEFAEHQGIRRRQWSQTFGLGPPAAITTPLSVTRS